MSDPAPTPGPPPAPPLAMLVELTHRCPLQCPYCSNPLELIAAGGEMDTEAWLGVIGEAAEMGILQIHFSGGEPTVRKDLDLMVGRAEELGLYTNLITSGALLDRARLESLAERGLQHVQLSFQAADEALADRIGGFPGGHRKKLEAARPPSQRADQQWTGSVSDCGEYTPPGERGASTGRSARFSA